jgi:adenylate cyclase
VRLAIEMRDKVEELSQHWGRQGYSLGFGIGIAAGYATLGQIGFEHRREYSAIGGVTNLASRLCDEARPGQILIAQRALSTIEGSVKVSHVGDLNLKGFNRPIAAYDVLSWCGQPAATDPSEIVASEGGGSRQR